MRLQFNARSAMGDVLVDTGIRALAVTRLAGVTTVIASTGAGGGVSLYRLRPDATLDATDSMIFAPTFTGMISRDIAVLMGGGGAQLLLGGAASGLFSYALGADGSIGGRIAPTALPGGPAAVATLAHLPGATGGGLLALGDATDGVVLYRMTGSGPVQVDVLPGQSAALALGATTGGAVLLSAGARIDHVLGFTVSDGSGPVPAGQAGPDEGLGMTAPTALRLVTAHGQDFALLAASGSSSLSVLQMQADGTFVLRDHLIDSLSSRFAKVQDLAVVKVAGQVFVLAGGSDDGVNLLTLLPDGRLIHLDAIAGSLQGGLDGITRLTAIHDLGALHVFAATQGDAGLAHLTVPMADIGAVIRGGGILTGTAGHDLMVAATAGATLQGGAGDDILVAAPGGGTTMTGGQGADLFVLQRNAGEVHITDFDPARDRLDLSDFAFLRSPDQLSVTPRTGGARITFGDEGITLDSHDGRPLEVGDLFGHAFEGPDRLGFFTSRDAGGGDTAPPPPFVPDPDNHRLLDVSSEDPNPWLAGAQLRFTPDGGPALSMTADAQGRFDLSAVSGQTGHLQISRGHSTGDPAIGVTDALNILRLAVGLQPSFGPATPGDLIAADLDRDGAVSVSDALDALRFAVGLQPPNAPQWLYLDGGSDLSGISSGAVPMDEGTQLVVSDTGSAAFHVTAILLGNVEGWA